LSILRKDLMISSRINLKSFTREGLKDLITSLGWKTYRADQIFQWLWQKGSIEFDGMTNLAQRYRAELKRRFRIGQMKVCKQIPAQDGSVKYLFQLEDGVGIESVYMPEPSRRSVCVSVQVGCPLHCHFCATGRSGFIRNLRAWEIADQVVTIQRLEGVRISHVVFMGMGEPMLNLDEVLKSVEILNDDLGPNIGARRMTISTAGIPEGIIRLIHFPLPIKLAVSLNAATDRIRSLLMPINRRYPIRKVIAALHRYVAMTNRMVTIEYVMFQGLNTTKEEGLRLIRLVKKLKCKINLIPYNPIDGCDLLPPEEDEMMSFYELLRTAHKTVTIRKSRGKDVEAGCGQLRSRPLSVS